jgi:hypothetical protein
MKEHDEFASKFVSLCVVICVCFKAESDFPDPNVERSSSLRHPIKGEFDLSMFLICVGFSVVFVVRHIQMYCSIPSAESQTKESFLENEVLRNKQISFRKVSTLCLLRFSC